MWKSKSLWEDLFSLWLPCFETKWKSIERGKCLGNMHSFMKITVCFMTEENVKLKCNSEKMDAYN